MNTFFEPPIDKNIGNSSMVSPIENSLYNDHRLSNDATSLTTFDRFSSLGRVTHGGYPSPSLCLVNEGCPEAYFGHVNQFRSVNGTSPTTPAVYSWCDTSGQKMHTFSMVPSNVW